MTSPTVRATGVLLALLTGLATILGAGPAAASTTDEPDEPATTVAVEPSPVVLVALAGLYWSDVSPTATPTLWGMIRSGAVASLSAGRTTCTTDAWLTLSAGQMVSTPAPETSDETPEETDEADGADGTVPDPRCAPLPEPAVQASGEASVTPAEPGPAEVPGWSALTAPTQEAAATGTHLPPGTVATRLAATSSCTTAVGPGAAVMLADAGGRVARYAPDLGAVPEGGLGECAVTVIDQGELVDTAARRGESLDHLDDTLARVTAEAAPGTRVLVAGVSAGPVGEPGLQVVVDWRPGDPTNRWLHSPSTQKDGIVQLVDLSATVLEQAGADLDGVDGSPLVLGETRRLDVARTVENRQYLNVLTSTIPAFYPVLVGLLVAALVVTLGGALWARRAAARRAGGKGDGPGDGSATRRSAPVVSAVAMVVAAAPVAASLASLSRWWVTSAPAAVLALALAVGAVVVALVAWLVSRLLPRRPWALPTSLAGVTWLVLTVDGATGTTLQQASVLGTSAVVGFTRFYGFNNVTFAVYAVSGLVLAAGLASAALDRGRRRLATGLVLAVGAATVVIDGWPAFGADFGGILALVPAFAVLALLVARVRITWVRMLVLAAVTVLVVAVVSVVDWLVPGGSSHLGGFVQTILDGGALEVVGRKAMGAWTTVASPVGALAAVLVVLAAYAALRPERARLPEVARAYDRWPLLRPLVVSLVVVAGVGSCLNDSGIIIAVMVALVGTALVVTGFTRSGRAAAGDATEEAASGTTANDRATAPADDAPPVTRMPTTLATVGGGLLLALLLTMTAVPSPTPIAGDVPSGTGQAAIDQDAPLVVVGTSGIAMGDVSAQDTPALWRLLHDDAAAAGVAPAVSGPSSWCVSAGWLALSSGRAPVTGSSADGEWECLPWTVDAPAEGASADGPGPAAVDGWSDLADAQSNSVFNPHLGVLGGALADAGVCATAVGPAAALALADADGAVARYATLDAATTDPATFACPLTVVDAGDASPVRTVGSGAAGTAADADATAEAKAQAEEAAEAERRERLRAVDATVRRVVDAAPVDATVLVVDVGGTAGGRPSLGAGVLTTEDQTTPRFLSASSTKWEGVVRLLDVPTSILTALDVPIPADFTGAPLVTSAPRPSDVATTVDQVADVTARDHALRGVAGSVTTLPLWIALALLGAAAFAGPAVRRRSPRLAGRLRHVLDAVLTVVAAMPAGLYLMTTFSWWRFSSPEVAMWVSMAVGTAVVAGLASLAPRRPLWAGPGVVAALTFVVLTLDAALGTPLHRGSPLGPSPTLGGRYYGFGNPTFSVYIVAALVTAAVVGTLLLRRGRRGWAVAAVVGIGLVAAVVDLWPSLGADVGGGLVVVPAFAVLAFFVAGARFTLRRFLLIGVAGVVAVAAIGLVDWLRPAADRTHLGIFVQSVVDGTAWETVSRKAGYALSTVTSGVPAWLTIAVVVLVALMVWRRVAWQPRWFGRVEAGWPMVRPLLVALLVAGLAGAVVNDYGVRILTVMLFAAVPLFGMMAVRAPLVDPDGGTGVGPDADADVSATTASRGRPRSARAGR